MNALKVYTTGHNAEKQSVFIDDLKSKEQTEKVTFLYGAFADGAIDLNNNADIEAFHTNNSHTIPKQGSSCAVLTLPPGANTSDFTHRTLSVDICVVIQGQIESHLDSGEKRLIKQGEVLIQRGTNHYWANPGTVPCKMFCVLLPAKPIEGADDNIIGN